MTTYVFERYDRELTEEEDIGDVGSYFGWNIRTTVEGPIQNANKRMTSILNEQYPAVPTRLLFVEISENSHRAVEVKVKPTGVELEAV